MNWQLGSAIKSCAGGSEQLTCGPRGESVILSRPVQEAGELLRGSGCFRRFGIRICRRFQGQG